jgi:hypothetical protein
MNRFGFRFIAGAVLLLIGASIVADLLFQVSLPLVRAAFALLFLLFGARLLAGAWSRGPRRVDGEAWLADRRFAPAGALHADARYDVVFGRGLIDLTEIDEPDDDVTVTVDTLFGSAVVRVDPTIAYEAEGSSAFGEIRMPDLRAAAMGSLHYQSPADHRPRLHLKLNTVFGACQVVEAPRPAAT